MWDLFARLGEFAEAVIGYWYLWVTGVLFAIDQGLSNKYMPVPIVKRIDKAWPPENRHHLFRLACVSGFVIASFQAFDHADEQRQRAETALHTATTDLSIKEAETQRAQRFLDDVRRQLAEATKEPPRPAFDLAGSDNIEAKTIQICGEQTVVKSQPGSNGSLRLEGFTGIAPNANCSFPPPSQQSKQLSDRDLIERARQISTELDKFDERANEARTIYLSDDERNTLDAKDKSDLTSTFLEPAMELARAITARTGPVEIREAANENDIKALQLASSTRHGRASLLFGKLIGLHPATDIASYLRLIAGKLEAVPTASK